MAKRYQKLLQDALVKPPRCFTASSVEARYRCLCTKIIAAINIFLVLACLSVSVMASEMTDLYKDGYYYAMITRVKGYFDGCEPGKKILLEHKRKFICATYDHTNSGRDLVVCLLRHHQTDDIKILIDGHEYDGEMVDAEGVKIRR